jgi:endonuclease/exonuclease/phosphatase family metal-dependent hydrolase
LRKLVIITVSLLLSLIILYYWASSPAISKKEKTSITTFQETNKELSDTISVMTFNIGYLSGLSNNKAVRISPEEYYANLLESIEHVKELSPDIIAFQEIDFNSKRSSYSNQHDSIAIKANFNYGAVAINWDMNYLPFPYFPISAHFGKILSGQSILSKYKIISNEVEILPKPKEKPFWYKRFYIDRLLQHSVVRNLQDIHIYNVHLEAYDTQTRENHIKLVVNEVEKNQDKPFILMGDFNSVLPSTKKKHSFSDEPDTDFRNDKSMKYLMDHLNIKFAADSSIVDTKNFYTFPSDNPSRKLDYIFYNPEYFTVIEVKTIKSTISDHLAVYAKLVWIK